LRLEELFEEAGRSATFMLAPGSEVRREVEAAVARGASAIAVGGGDGTLSAAAGVLAGSAIPLGVIPLGTLNHFARDLGVPLGLDEATAIILAGHTERIDVAEVNGRVFINNSSVGLYPRIVRIRKRWRVRGFGKWAVAAWAALKVISRTTPIGVRIRSDEGRVVQRTPLIMVGNNEYHLEGVEAGRRESLRNGELAVYVVKARRASEIVRLVWIILRRRVRDSGLVDVLHVDAATIEPSRSPLHVAIDGEVEVLHSPLLYRIRPGDLSVFVPGAKASPGE
jgi:diacylglycerol kinase family enzyme